MMCGKFITIEGTEGAGKSTALTFIAEHLKRCQIEVMLTREPGGTDRAEEIRRVLLQTTNKEAMLAETELLLMFAARAQHIRYSIRPALEAGRWVLSDRYVDASYAYQGGGRQLAIEQIAALDHWVVGELYPDLTLLLDVPAELGMMRAEKRGQPKDRIEQEQMAFFTRVREAYLERAKQDCHRIKIIDAGLPLQSVEEQIRHVINAFLLSHNL